MTEVSKARKLNALSHLDTVISNAWWNVHKANKDATVWGDRDLSAEVYHASQTLERVMKKVKRAQREAGGSTDG